MSETTGLSPSTSNEAAQRHRCRFNTIHDHRHTAAVHLARAGKPLHLLQQQLGHKHIDMAMKYARFHPDYSDVADYFNRAGRALGLSAGAGHSLGHTPSPELHNAED